MQEWKFKEKYELIETLLKEINQGRKNFQSDSTDDGLLAPIFYMYDVMEKNALFIRDEYRNSIEPAVENLYALTVNNDEESTERLEKWLKTAERIGYEKDCLEAMLMMNSELMVALFKKMFPEDEQDPEIIKGYHIGPEVDFDKMSRLPSVLKVSDFESTARRLEWLIDHYHDGKNAKRYLKARQDLRKEYKKKLKMKKVNQ